MSSLSLPSPKEKKKTNYWKPKFDKYLCETTQPLSIYFSIQTYTYLVYTYILSYIFLFHFELTPLFRNLISLSLFLCFYVFLISDWLAIWSILLTYLCFVLWTALSMVITILLSYYPVITILLYRVIFQIILCQALLKLKQTDSFYSLSQSRTTHTHRYSYADIYTDTYTDTHTRNLCRGPCRHLTDTLRRLQTPDRLKQSPLQTLIQIPIQNP